MKAHSAISGKVLVLPPSREREWDAFVAKSAVGLVYQTSAWKKTLERAFPHIRGHILGLTEADGVTLRGGLPIFTVRSWLLGTRLVSIPFAPITDPIAENPGDVALLLEAVAKLKQEHGAKRVEIRTRRSDAQWLGTALSRTSDYVHHFVPIHPDTGAIFRTFSRTAVQQEIKRAQKSGYSVVEDASESGHREFYQLFSDTRRRLSLPPIPCTFFDGLRSELGGHSLLLSAQRDGVVAGSLVLTHFGSTCSAEFVGDRRADTKTGIAHLLYWQAIQWAAVHGYTEFSFGRTSQRNLDLIRFKQRWGAKEETLSTFGDHPATVRRSRESSLVYKAARLVTRHLPPMAYRQLGNFVYRHMG